MATPHVTSINPNSPFEYHPPALTWHVQAIDNPCHDEKGHIPILEPVAGTHREPSLQQILNRVASQHLIGKQALMDFLHHKSLAHCKIKTLANYCTTIIPFLNEAQALGRSQLDQLKPVDLEAFVERLQDRGMKPATLRLRLMCIYRFLRYLVESDKLFSDRFVRTIRIKTPQTLPMAMPPNDVHRLLSVVSDIRNRAMIVVLLRTGMRIGELLTLKVYDVRLSEQKALIWEGEKNSVGRVVCLSADALLALSRWFDSRDPHKEYLFYRRRGHNMCYATARIMFRKYLNKAGRPAQPTSHLCHRPAQCRYAHRVSAAVAGS